MPISSSALLDFVSKRRRLEELEVLYIMIVFLESDKNDFTVDFNPPIRASKVRLISCSLFNSWYNLIGGTVPNNSGTHSAGSTFRIPDSHYTPITLAKELAKYNYTLTTGLPHEMTLKSNRVAYARILAGSGVLERNAFERFLDIPIKKKNNIIYYDTNPFPVKWPVPNAYEVHCSLVRTYENGRFSNMMAKFTPKGQPFDLVEYRPIALTYELSPDLVESIHIVIKVDGEIVNFNDRKINLVLEFSSH